MKIKMISLILLLLFIILICIIFITNNKELLVIENYNEFVITTNSTNIYTKEKDNYYILGKLDKGVFLHLESIEGNYYKVKDTPYYVSYNGLLKTTNIPNKEIIPFNLNIITKDSFSLYKDNTKVIKINSSMDFVIYEQNKKYYLVSFLGDMYYLNKEDVKKTYENNNYEGEVASYIPVLSFSDISKTCYNNCITKELYDKYITYLKDNNYNTIDMDTYLKWINGYINLPSKTVVIISNELDDNLIINKTDIKFSHNKASIKNNKNDYIVNNNTSIGKFIDMINGKNIIDNNINDSVNAVSIPVLNYHFFYDSRLGETGLCNETICEDVVQFEEHLKYLNDNGFKTLTIDEFINWMYGNIELPEKSVLITVDDGAFGTSTHLIKIIEKYQVNAVLFLVTGWWSRESYISNYLEVESHSNKMHTNGMCKQPKILCLSKKDIIKDLNISTNLIGSNKAFCYPFYKYNDNAIEAVKEAGFKLAFAGGNIDAVRDSNKYAVPRYPIFNYMTINDFIKIVN